MERDLAKIKVSDNFGARRDPKLPSVALALDPATVKQQFKRGLPRLGGRDGQVVVKSVRVIRHKPGRRCVIEYDVRIEQPDAPRQKAMLIGKIRAGRFGHEALRLQEAIWHAGFRAGDTDGIAVPEPIGLIPRFQMWLQRKVPGELASSRLGGPGGVAIARRIAEAICKLHQARVPVKRRHTMADELRILHDCLERAAQIEPVHARRIVRVLEACDRLGASLQAPVTCGIHRDFYPEQVIIDGARLYLLDFDLFCEGDPALDVGNFLGHMAEESLRSTGRPDALRDREVALEDRFIELTGERARQRVHAYATLTLARHIFLSTQFPERNPTTEPLIALCEERLMLATGTAMAI
jgi:hypothetical protein